MSRNVIIGPVMTEKANYVIFDKTGKYVFKVLRDATKMEIKQEIEKLYNVEVEKINTSIPPRKWKSLRGRGGYTSGWKKAYITLKKGKIPIFEEINPQPIEKETKPKKEESKKTKEKASTKK